MGVLFKGELVECFNKVVHPCWSSKSPFGVRVVSYALSTKLLGHGQALQDSDQHKVLSMEGLAFSPEATT